MESTPMNAQLVVTEGPNRGQVFALAEGQAVVIGRGRTTNTRLLDPRVSREHCRVQSRGESIVITDLGSVGGTYVNGSRVDKQSLREGDVIRVGETALRLDCVDL